LLHAELLDVKMNCTFIVRVVILFGCSVILLISVADRAPHTNAAIGGAAVVVALSVDAAADARLISPLIYRINTYGFSSAELAVLN
jgi:hypothetical protein